MATASPRRGPWPLELGLGAGMLVLGLVAAPLGLDRVAAAPFVEAALQPLRGGEGALPLVTVFLRLCASLPVGDLPARLHFGAVLAAALAAVLLARLGFCLLRLVEADPDELDDDDEAPEETDDFPPVRADGGRAGAPVPLARALPRQTMRGPRIVPATQTPVWAAAPAPTRVTERASGSAPLVGPPPRAATHEVFAVAGATTAALASLGVFLALTSAPATALSLAVLLAGWLLLFGFYRRPGTPRRGFTLALLTGFALGADPFVPLLLLPPLVFIAWRLWRTGERWPRFAPVAFGAGALLLLPWFGRVSGPLGALGAALGGLGGVFTPAGRSELFAVMTAAGTEWGIVTVLIACVGGAVILSRRPRLFAAGAAVAALALGAAASAGGPPNFHPGGMPWVVLAALVVLPCAVGIVRLSATLGRARGAGALVLAVITVVWPLCDGGAIRWHRGPGLPDALLDRAYTRLPIGTTVTPGSPEMTRLFEYGTALGLRPDLQFAPTPPPPSIAAR